MILTYRHCIYFPFLICVLLQKSFFDFIFLQSLKKIITNQKIIIKIYAFLCSKNLVCSTDYETVNLDGVKLTKLQSYLFFQLHMMDPVRLVNSHALKDCVSYSSTTDLVINAKRFSQVFRQQQVSSEYEGAIECKCDYSLFQLVICNYNDQIGKRLRFLSTRLFAKYQWEVEVIDKVSGAVIPVFDNEECKFRFRADPFLHCVHGDTFLFVEGYSDETDYGVLACYHLLDGAFVLKHVYDCGAHASFPFIYAEGNDLFVVPETTANKKLSLLSYDKQNGFVQVAELMNNIKIFDPVLFRVNDLYLLLGSVSTFEYSDDHSELRLFWSQNLNSGWDHKKSSFIRYNAFCSRSGGSVVGTSDGYYSRYIQGKSDYRYAKNFFIEDFRISVSNGVPFFESLNIHEHGHGRICLHTLTMTETHIATDHQVRTVFLFSFFKFIRGYLWFKLRRF